MWVCGCVISRQQKIKNICEKSPTYRSIWDKRQAITWFTIYKKQDGQREYTIRNRIRLWRKWISYLIDNLFDCLFVSIFYMHERERERERERVVVVCVVCWFDLGRLYIYVYIIYVELWELVVVSSGWYIMMYGELAS